MKQTTINDILRLAFIYDHPDYDELLVVGNDRNRDYPVQILYVNDHWCPDGIDELACYDTEDPVALLKKREAQEQWLRMGRVKDRHLDILSDMVHDVDGDWRSLIKDIPPSVTLKDDNHPLNTFLA